jgi:hypothetical protein
MDNKSIVRQSKNIRLIFSILLGVFLLAGLINPARAQEGVFGGTRINEVHGTIYVLPHDGEYWIEASVNYPLETGDQIRSEAESRAEVVLYDGTILRVDELTTITLDDVSPASGPEALHIGLDEGKLYVLQPDGGSHLVIQAGAQNVMAEAAGGALFRIDSFSNETLQVFVHSGQLQLNGPSGTSRISAGQMVTLSPGNQMDIASLPPQDDFDRWSLGRSEVIAPPRVASPYLPPEIVRVYPNLDPYGRWVYVSDYGHCWVPRVGPGWRPFHHGRWLYWRGNYTWLSYEPWGWVPYHYGRWFYSVSFGWCWVPPVRSEVFWCPGAVAWYYDPEYVYWIPLAPREVYYGRGYFGPHSVNVVNVHITEVNVYKVHPHKIVLKNIHAPDPFIGVKKDHFFKGKYAAMAVADQKAGRERVLYQGMDPVLDKQAPRIAHVDEKVVKRETREFEKRSRYSHERTKSYDKRIQDAVEPEGSPRIHERKQKATSPPLKPYSLADNVDNRAHRSALGEGVKPLPSPDSSSYSNYKAKDRPTHEVSEPAGVSGRKLEERDRERMAEHRPKVVQPDYNSVQATDKARKKLDVQRNDHGLGPQRREESTYKTSVPQVTTAPPIKRSPSFQQPLSPDNSSIAGSRKREMQTLPRVEPPPRFLNERPLQANREDRLRTSRPASPSQSPGETSHAYERPSRSDREARVDKRRNRSVEQSGQTAWDTQSKSQ